MSKNNEELLLFWRQSSQRAAELYESGTKFWNKTDLRDIEDQLSTEAREFTVQSINGDPVSTPNIMFGARGPIWYGNGSDSCSSRI